MFKIMMALHLLTAIFAIGPLVGAATSASRGLRKADAAATESAERTLTVYSFASVAVVFFGFALMSAPNPFKEGHPATAKFTEPFIWVSLILWVVSIALTLGVIAPTLGKATVAIKDGTAVDTMTGKVAAFGGIVGLIYATIVVLMVYRPGS